jgi:hypothetical protein
MAVTVTPGRRLGERAVAVKPLLIGVEDLAIALNRSHQGVRRDCAKGLLPAAVRGGGAQGKRQLWSLSEIQAWVDAGCPTRDKWEAIKNAKQSRKR